MIAKITHFALTGLFLLMAYIQLNDPDPVYWTTVYIAVASIPALALLGQRSFAHQLIVLGGVLAGLLMSFTGFVEFLLSKDYASLTGAMSADKPYVEHAREFIGLCMALVCLGGYAAKTNCSRTNGPL